MANIVLSGRDKASAASNAVKRSSLSLSASSSEQASAATTGAKRIKLYHKQAGTANHNNNSQAGAAIHNNNSQAGAASNRQAGAALGQIRVGTRKGDKDPHFDGFIPIVCLTKSTAYGALGPYLLRDEDGELIENAWQRTKVLKNIPRSVQRRSRYDRTIIWQHNAFQGVDAQGNLTPEWFQWSKKLGQAQDPVRYPLTWDPKVREKTIGCYSPLHCERPNVDCLLDIPNSRKKIYFAKYIPAVKQQPLYARLKEMLEQGKNLLIVDIDGPKAESLKHYKDTYGVADDFIVNDTILITRENLEIMINDPKHSVGHCFGLSGSLLGMEDLFAFV